MMGVQNSCFEVVNFFISTFVNENANLININRIFKFDDNTYFKKLIFEAFKIIDIGNNSNNRYMTLKFNIV